MYIKYVHQLKGPSEFAAVAPVLLLLRRHALDPLLLEVVIFASRVSSDVRSQHHLVPANIGSVHKQVGTPLA